MLFHAYGVPEEVSSDGGPQFTVATFQNFLKNWGVKHQSSAFYTQSNGRAELAVKTSKRILENNMSSDGAIDNDKVAQAILQYHNTLLPYIHQSPAQILFHHQLKDCVPCPIHHYKLHKNWVVLAVQHEQYHSK